MTVQCAWCQQEIPISSDSPFQGHPEAHSICADCIIPMLPKTLLIDHTPGTSAPSQEQRNAQRIPLISEIYLTSNEKFNQITHALITDMSDSGMKIQIETPLVRGEIITLGFLGRKMIYKAIAEVVRSQASPSTTKPLQEVGIRLTGIHQNLRQNSGFF